MRVDMCVEYCIQFAMSTPIEAAITPLRSVIFDFDGLIVDSESASRQAWQEEYGRYQLTLDDRRWSNGIGTVGGFDPLAELADRLGDDFDREGTDTRRRGRWDELTRASGLRPGVAALVEEAAGAGVVLAIASSSLRGWVVRHLAHVGLHDHFDVIVGRDDVGDRPKPAPDVYLEALRRLDLTVDEVIALEDSHHGVAAANAARVPVVAVPNPVTAATNLSAAFRIMPSLEGVTLHELARARTPATTR